jgi:uncharacterized UPF0146 family protein
MKMTVTAGRIEPNWLLNDLSKYADLIRSFPDFIPDERDTYRLTADDIEASNARNQWEWDRDEIDRPMIEAFEEMHNAPRAFRPTRALFLAIASILANDDYLQLSEAEFVALVMKATGGSSTPGKVREMVKILLDEAGC